MKDLLFSIMLSLRDVFRPRILLFLIITPAIALAFWLTLIIVFWTDLTTLTSWIIESSHWTMAAADWFQKNSPFTMVSAVTVLLVILSIFPLFWISTLMLLSFLAMPIIQRHLEQGAFKDLQKKGDSTFWRSISHILKSGIIFLILWMTSLLFWALPPLGPILSFFSLSYMNAQVFTFESLVDWTHPAELKTLSKKFKFEFYFLGMMMAILTLIPFINILVPVLGCLCFSHFGLRQLRKVRGQSVS